METKQPRRTCTFWVSPFCRRPISAPKYNLEEKQKSTDGGKKQKKTAYGRQCCSAGGWSWVCAWALHLTRDVFASREIFVFATLLITASRSCTETEARNGIYSAPSQPVMSCVIQALRTTTSFLAFSSASGSLHQSVAKLKVFPSPVPVWL